MTTQARVTLIGAIAADAAPKRMTKKAAAEIIGGVSRPEKMPCLAYSLPTAICKVGGVLRDIAGSVCSDCYADKGNYLRYRDAIQTAQYRRLGAVHTAIESPAFRESFIQAFAVLLAKESFFRWHDSGDLLNVNHLTLIMDIADACPGVTFWLPTRELDTVRKALHMRSKPVNLSIRISATMIDGKAPAAPAGCLTSTVSSTGQHVGQACPAPTQGNACADCRACWSADVANVSYTHH